MIVFEDVQDIFIQLIQNHFKNRLYSGMLGLKKVRNIQQFLLLSNRFSYQKNLFRFLNSQILFSFFYLYNQVIQHTKVYLCYVDQLYINITYVKYNTLNSQSIPISYVQNYKVLQTCLSDMHQEYQQPTQKYQQQEQTLNQQLQNQEQSQPQRQSVPEFNAYRPQLTISQDSPNQLITVLLEPNQVLWYRGQVVAANRPFQNREKIDHIDIDRLMHYLKYKWNMPTKLTNTGIDMAYYCIRRRGGGGKILYLEEQVYGQNFMIDMTKLLTINVDPLEIQLTPAKSFPQLYQIKQKQNNNNQSLILTLQSSPNNAIYEKSLGPSQKLYIGTSNVIAMSSYLSVSKNQNNGQICLTGPGIVFLEAPNLPYNMQLQSQGQMNGLVSLFFAICIISIGLLGIFLWID